MYSKVVLTSVWKTDDWQKLVGVRLLYTPPLKEIMYKIIGKEESFRVLTLAEAMNVAKSLNEFVTIIGQDFEVCGKFGVDSIQDGYCPDGVEYDWNKASRIGEPRRR